MHGWFTEKRLNGLRIVVSHLFLLRIGRCAELFVCGLSAYYELYIFYFQVHNSLISGSPEVMMIAVADSHKW